MGSVSDGDEFCERGVQFVAVKDDVVWRWFQDEAGAISTVRGYWLWGAAFLHKGSSIFCFSFPFFFCLSGDMVLFISCRHSFIFFSSFFSSNNCIYSPMKFMNMYYTCSLQLEAIK